MYSVEVKNRIMIAHSLPREVFGKAQGLHGATYGVSVSFFAEKLDENGLVVDMGRAMEVLDSVLEPINYQNLDDLPQFQGLVTTTEYMCGYIFQRVCDAVYLHKLARGPEELDRIRVTLTESDVASASFEAPLTASEVHNE
ncbi:6-carboxytetrahydropterin synthase [Pseudovibrio exalbescens]|uniref:6-pyruvoyl trahydropterin synthase family protein n=1 Tax=Pseudovibrio exalbescens TaxID=197461 RepID=UPI002366139F|nr:6-carboxytetrahydropterin synthase [Pseudovibrio exalbescens]MDD7909902.1 6-carboxytetrahydropterin synthase [Pseudovibrio exalbescens]